jgi:hypothetical protein
MIVLLIHAAPSGSGLRTRVDAGDEHAARPPPGGRPDC